MSADYPSMTTAEIRSKFLNFFEERGLKLYPSSSLVPDDPSLLLANAGMNQFKDLFLGNSPVRDRWVADSQKCLRVSGKHNDLEEVGLDTYHQGVQAAARPPVLHRLYRGRRDPRRVAFFGCC